MFDYRMFKKRVLFLLFIALFIVVSIRLISAVNVIGTELVPQSDGSSQYAICSVPTADGADTSNLFVYGSTGDPCSAFGGPETIPIPPAIPPVTTFSAINVKGNMERFHKDGSGFIDTLKSNAVKKCVDGAKAKGLDCVVENNNPIYSINTVFPKKGSDNDKDYACPKNYKDKVISYTEKVSGSAISTDIAQCELDLILQKAKLDGVDRAGSGFGLYDDGNDGRTLSQCYKDGIDLLNNCPNPCAYEVVESVDKNLDKDGKAQVIFKVTCVNGPTIPLFGRGFIDTAATVTASNDYKCVSAKPTTVNNDNTGEGYDTTGGTQEDICMSDTNTCSLSGDPCSSDLDCGSNSNSGGSDSSGSGDNNLQIDSAGCYSDGFYADGITTCTYNPCVCPDGSSCTTQSDCNAYHYGVNNNIHYGYYPTGYTNKIPESKECEEIDNEVSLTDGYDPIYIDKCQHITSDGDYILSNDLETSADGQDCLVIDSNVKKAIIDGDMHTIKGHGHEMSSDDLGAGVNILGIGSYKIQNIVIDSTNYGIYNTYAGIGAEEKQTICIENAKISTAGKKSAGGGPIDSTRAGPVILDISQSDLSSAPQPNNQRSGSWYIIGSDLIDVRIKNTKVYNSSVISRIQASYGKSSTEILDSDISSSLYLHRINYVILKNDKIHDYSASGDEGVTLEDVYSSEISNSEISGVGVCGIMAISSNLNLKNNEIYKFNTAVSYFSNYAYNNYAITSENNRIHDSDYGFLFGKKAASKYPVSEEDPAVGNQKIKWNSRNDLFYNNYQDVDIAEGSTSIKSMHIQDGESASVNGDGIIIEGGKNEIVSSEIVNKNPALKVLGGVNTISAFTARDSSEGIHLEGGTNDIEKINIIGNKIGLDIRSKSINTISGFSIVDNAYGFSILGGNNKLSASVYVPSAIFTNKKLGGLIQGGTNELNNIVVEDNYNGLHITDGENKVTDVKTIHSINENPNDKIFVSGGDNQFVNSPWYKV